ncbi:MAG: hypothetical protein ABEJ31_15370 [Haloarculaceae archaeon]
MLPELLSMLLAVVLTVTMVAAGAYVGALRALDVYHSDADSVFLPDRGDGRGR